MIYIFNLLNTFIIFYYNSFRINLHVKQNDYIDNYRISSLFGNAFIIYCDISEIKFNLINII